MGWIQGFYYGIQCIVVQLIVDDGLIIYKKKMFMIELLYMFWFQEEQINNESVEDDLDYWFQVMM